VGGLLGWALIPSREVDAPISFIGDAIVSQLSNYDGSETSGVIAPDGRAFAFVSNQGGTADVWLRQISGGDPVRLTNDAATEAGLAYAPDGEGIYYTRSEGTDTSIWRIGALGGQPRKVLSDARHPALSPDGRRIAWFAPEPGGFFSLVVTALDGSGRRVLAENVQGVVDVSRAAWSSNGASIAYISAGLFAPRNLFVVDVANGGLRQVTRFTRSQEGPNSAAWLPDNRHLVVSYFASTRALGASDLGILDSVTGSITRFTTNVAQGFNGPSLSADGRRMVVTANSAQREVWKVPFGPDAQENGRAAVRVVDATLDPMWTFVTRDGKTLLFNNALVGSRNLWTMPLDGSSRPRQITSMAGNATMHASLSPDGAHVAFASSATGNSDVWIQHVDGSDLRQLTNDAPAEAWPVWSPDGEWIMFASLREGGWETRRIRPAGGPAEKVVDGFFRGDWVTKPDGSGTWIVTSMEGGGLRLLDGERRTVMWQDWQPGNAMPIFSPDRQSVSIAYSESRDRDAIWVYDVATGTKRVAAKFPQQFHISFRANWVEEGRAFIVNRSESTSHIVMFDGFWKATPRAGK
jgi:Tol biopolymer transport system component